MTQPYGPPGQYQSMPQPTQQPKRKRTVPLWVFILALTAMMFASCVAGVGIGSTDTTTTEPAAATEPKDTPTPTDEPSKKPAKAPETKKPEPKKTEAPKPPKHEKITIREWAKIAKNPDAHVGERIVVHGWVTQFDAATGTDGFLADTGGKKLQPEYGFVDYPTNTAFTGDAGMLADLVEFDLFTARVTVMGSLDYETQIGGNTTVPLLAVDSIKITGNLPL